MHTTAYVIGIICLLAGSAFFSASETAFTSVNVIRLKNRAESGDRKARRVLTLVENYDKLLSTILIGNNIVNITAASLATVVFVGMLGERGVTVSTIVLTMATLIFGEISPKTLAKEKPEEIATLVAPVIMLIMWVFTPFTFLFQQLQRLLIVLAGGDQDKAITEEELMTIVDEVEEGGNIEAGEGALIRSAILFDDRYVRDIYTPRVNVEAVPDDATYEEVAERFIKTGYSRLPVYNDTIDNILGVLHVKDFYAMLLKKEERPLTEIIKPLAFIMQNRDLARLMNALQKDKSHMAVVTDEYGGTVGIVTLEDVIEELVGDIWDEHDREPLPQVEKVAPGVYLMEGQIEVEDVLPHFGIDTEHIEAMTVGGWITDKLGHIPVEGETVREGAIVVRVEEATPRYVEKVRLSVEPQKQESREEE